MEGDLEVKNINLGGLAPYFSGEQEDKRNVLLYDSTGNAYTFFKYKARLIDCAQMGIQVATNYKPKEDVIEEVRKGLAYGIKQGQVVVLHFGENSHDWNQFFKNQPFWNPKKLLAPCDKYDSEWYRANVMKADDVDMFGNKGSLFPSDKFLIMLSFTKDVELKDLPWLSDCKEFFFKLRIQ